jgi:Condensation domain.
MISASVIIIQGKYMNLTKPQKLIYDMEKFAGGSIAVICGSMLTPGKREISELKRAVNEVNRLNDVLRIRINEGADGVSQNITEYEERELEVLRFADKAELDRYAQSYAKEPLDFNGDLCEIKIILLSEQYGVLVKLHHIIGDAWTLSLIGNQFNAILNGETPEAYSYADYVESEKEYVGSRRYEKGKVFFSEQFQKCDEVTYLSEKQSDSFVANRKTFVIDKDGAKK